MLYLLQSGKFILSGFSSAFLLFCFSNKGDHRSFLRRTSSESSFDAQLRTNPSNTDRSSHVLDLERSYSDISLRELTAKA
ncbi:hypothetical protein C8R47DRAFT_334747 [Mycena vitilis]|nr:hypothetical protein C8R47DRAFT_334747 [Mycena vitilis]